MSNLYTFFGIILGGLLILIRMFIALNKNNSIKPLALNEAIILILSCVAIGTAFELGLLIFENGSVTIDESQKLYIFLGGVALFWVSAQSVIKIFKS